MANDDSAALFTLLVESVEDYAIFILDPEGRVKTWNAGAERIKGYTADEIVGRHFTTFYREQDLRSGEGDRLLAAAAQHGKVDVEGYRVRKDGSTFWASVVITALHDASGKLVGYAKVVRDLTERRKAEEDRLRLETERVARQAAEEARSSLATTLRSIGDGVITTDARGHVAMINPIAEQLTGWTEEEARGQPLRRVFAIVNEETRREVENPVDRVLREGAIVGLANHTVLLSRGGGETPISDSGAPIRDSSGEIRGVVLVFRDGGRERRAEAQRSFLIEITRILSSSLNYRETLAKVAQIAVPQFADWSAVDIVEEGSPDPVQVVVAHANPKKVELARDLATKYPPDPNAPTGAPNVIRTGRSEFYPELPQELLESRAVDAEHARLIRELQLKSAIVVPITDGTHVRGAMTLVFAESNRRYTEEDLELLEEVGRRAGVALENARLYTSELRAREVADAANRMKDEFLATVSHELRTPLNAILGWAKLINRYDFDPTKLARATATIERNAVAMAQLIEDLLDVTRIISGKMRLDTTSLELVPVVEAALESVRPAAEAKHIQIARELDPHAGAVLGDATRLQQVVWNLLSNAVKFTPPGGRVRVSLSRGDTNLELRVEDTGRGITPQFLPHVFDPFRQADGSVSRTAGGLGLGLAITKQLVELHGGQIHAESPGEGKGATFIVRIPLASATPLGRPRARSAPELDRADLGAALRGLKVLVVDDDPDARQLLETILADAGAVVQLAQSADEAVEAFDEEVPDVLISDIGLPGTDGLELIRRIRARPPGQGGAVPAAALTAYARAEERRNVLAAGFMMHVPKPVDPAELVMVVATLARYATR